MPIKDDEPDNHANSVTPGEAWLVLVVVIPPCWALGTQFAALLGLLSPSLTP